MAETFRLVWCFSRFVGWVPLCTLMLGPSWAQEEAVNGKKDDPKAGIEFQLILDQEELMFPDIIYGFVKVSDASGEHTYTPFPGRDVTLETRLVCTRPSAVTREIVSLIRPRSFGPPAVTRKRPFATSVMRFQLNRLNSQIVGCIREGASCAINAKARLRPLRIAIRDPDKKGVPFRYEMVGKDEEVFLEATVDIKYQIDRTIFKDQNSVLAKFAVNPPAWRSEETLSDIAFWNFKGIRTTDVEFHWRHLESVIIEKLPVMAVFPDRARTIQPLLRQDTASWRFLELVRLGLQFSAKRYTEEEFREIMSNAIDVLKQAGPSELFYLEERFPELVRDGLRIGSGNGAEVMNYLDKHWPERLEETFPDVNLSSVSRAKHYKERRDPHDIDIEHVRGVLAEYQQQPQ